MYRGLSRKYSLFRMCSNISEHQLKINCYKQRLLHMSLISTTNQKPMSKKDEVIQIALKKVSKAKEKKTREKVEAKNKQTKNRTQKTIRIIQKTINAMAIRTCLSINKCK